jgi:hypothetical protein
LSSVVASVFVAAEMCLLFRCISVTTCSIALTFQSSYHSNVLLNVTPFSLVEVYQH